MGDQTLHRPHGGAPGMMLGPGEGVPGRDRETGVGEGRDSEKQRQR